MNDAIKVLRYMLYIVSFFSIIIVSMSNHEYKWFGVAIIIVLNLGSLTFKVGD